MRGIMRRRDIGISISSFRGLGVQDSSCVPYPLFSLYYSAIDFTHFLMKQIKREGVEWSPEPVINDRHTSKTVYFPPHFSSTYFPTYLPTYLLIISASSHALTMNGLE